MPSNDTMSSINIIDTQVDLEDQPILKREVEGLVANNANNLQAMKNEMKKQIDEKMENVRKKIKTSHQEEMEEMKRETEEQIEEIKRRRKSR